jgi:hypothetical protein
MGPSPMAIAAVLSKKLCGNPVFHTPEFIHTNFL